MHPPIDMVEHTSGRHARTVLVDWMLGNACSYACSYCPASLHSGSIRWQRSDAVLAFFDRLHEHYVRHRGREVWLQFTGGEPTMHPQIVRVLDGARARGFSTSVISNASRTLRFWEKAVPSLDGAILTFHDEFAELDHFLAVCRLLEPRIPLHVNVTLHPDRFDRAHASALALRQALPSTTISLKPLRVDFGTRLYDYTDAQREVMRQGLPAAAAHSGSMPRGTMTIRRDGAAEEVLRANELVLRGANRWTGYRCNAGIESLRISGEGIVTRALCGAGGALGRLGEAFSLPVAPVICDVETCACVSDMLITKARTPAPAAA